MSVWVPRLHELRSTAPTCVTTEVRVPHIWRRNVHLSQGKTVTFMWDRHTNHKLAREWRTESDFCMWSFCFCRLHNHTARWLTDFWQIGFLWQYGKCFVVFFFRIIVLQAYRLNGASDFQWVSILKYWNTKDVNAESKNHWVKVGHWASSLRFWRYWT